MHLELKEIIAAIAIIFGGLAQFFHLKGRISVLEARQKDDRERMKASLERIETKLDSIDHKLDSKADK